MSQKIFLFAHLHQLSCSDLHKIFIVQIPLNIAGSAIPRSMQALMIAGNASDLFATHPPIDERIAALRAYAGASTSIKRGSINLARPANLGGTNVEFGRRRGTRQVADASKR